MTCSSTSSAASRATSSVVDAHDLLLPYFFPPRAFPGIFTHNFGCQDDSYFLSSSLRQPRPADLVSDVLSSGTAGLA
jgi:hypothetical protein